ncbi:Beta-glucuronidase [Cladobotryum mycophilum]|uniref:Beta-glucuronidase n=1 Tax=Cladobotryum mycophilum TaxID=491253 RepID=A0ABR0S4C9_9HYPO
MAATKYLVPLTLLLTEALAAGGLYPSYVGLSIELIGFPAFAGTKASPNQFSHNLMQTLAQVQGTPVIVRVGGNSADRAIYDKTLKDSTATSCPNADPDAVQCIGTTFFDSYGAFPAGTVYSHNFNLGAYKKSGFDTLTATVPMACKALRGQLEAWEIGNEPDLFIGSKRGGDYNAGQYANEWLNTTERFETLLRSSCPDLVGGIKYIAPSLSSPGSRLKLTDIFNAEGAGDAKVKQISVHNYMAGATQPGVTLQNTLMSHNAVTRSIGGHVSYAKTIESVKADYVIGEHNSLYGGGAAGLSDVFGAALWGMDFTLYAASTGVIKRVHFHQAVAPYYGKLAAGTFLAKSDTLEVKVLSLNGDADKDSGYGAYVNGDLKRIAALNLREFDSSSPQSSRGKQTYKLKVAANSTWTVKRLTAAGARDQSGITFNGFAYEASSNGRPARVTSRESNARVKADGSGNLSITVANTEAVVLVKV